MPSRALTSAPRSRSSVDDLELPLAGGDPQGGDADLVLGVDVGSLIEQDLGRLGVAIPDGRPQRFPCAFSAELT